MSYSIVRWPPGPGESRTADDGRDALLVNQVVEHDRHEREIGSWLAVGSRRRVFRNEPAFVLDDDEGSRRVGDVAGRHVNRDLSLKCLVLRRLRGDRRRCLAAAATRSGTASCGRGRKELALGGVHRESDDASLWHVRLPRERRIGGVGRRDPEVPIHVEPDGHERRRIRRPRCGVGLRATVLCAGDSDRTQGKNAGDEHPGNEFAHATS